jgi:hypothetical protein
MRVVVTGGRDFDDRAMLWAGLDRLYELSPITELIEGGARGADNFAGEWARWVNQAAGQEVVKHITVEAEWTKHGKSAGYLRNVRMADMRPDLVFAAPGGRGTTMMISIAHDRGIRVIYLEKMGVPRSTEPLD